MVLGFKEYIAEKLIVFGKGAKYGQVVFLVGGAGSGKGFAISKYIEGEKFKVRDVDEWKRLFLKIDSLEKKYPEIRGLNLRNPNDVFKLHTFVKQRDIKMKTFDLLLQDKKADHLPNLIFDETLKDMDNLYVFISKLIGIGYEPKNIHIVWVLTPYEQAVKQNAARSRQVPMDILLDTHEGVANNMFDIMSNRVAAIGPSLVNGDIVVVYNNPDSIDYYPDKRNIRSFQYVKVKESGHPIDKKKAASVLDKMQNFVPRTSSASRIFT